MHVRIPHIIDTATLLYNQVPPQPQPPPPPHVATNNLKTPDTRSKYNYDDHNDDMASSKNKPPPPPPPPLSGPFTTGPDKTGCVPLRIHTATQPAASSSNSASAQAPSATQHEQTAVSSSSPTHPIMMPDGRRTSEGEALPSPTEDWKPNFKRVQSWNREDLKRNAYKCEMEGEEPGEGTGFTEGGEGTRQL